MSYPGGGGGGYAPGGGGGEAPGGAYLETNVKIAQHSDDSKEVKDLLHWISYKN